jgi:hypothetical protein
VTICWIIGQVTTDPAPDVRDDDRIRRPAGDVVGRSSVTATIMLPVTGGGPYGHGGPGSPGPARMAPLVLLGHQVIGVGFDEQLLRTSGA